MHYTPKGDVAVQRERPCVCVWVVVWVCSGVDSDDQIYFGGEGSGACCCQRQARVKRSVDTITHPGFGSSSKPNSFNSIKAT